MSLADNLANPIWRLENLYSIKQEGSGKPIPFRMRPEQREVIGKLIEHPETPLYIIKARRLGLSTGIGVAMSDRATFSGGTKARLIERSLEFAKEKMVDIMRFAVESMPAEIFERYAFEKRSDVRLQYKVCGLDDSFLSSIVAGVKARGGDCSWLWVSEWGPIAHEDPKRSAEIRSGALPAARLGRRVVETTWMGGKGGDLWELIKPILEHDPDANGEVLFYPWHGDPACIRIDGGSVSRDVENYFGSLADKVGKRFNQEQKRWYVVEKKTQGIFMKREYPSTLDECFEAPVKGAIYAEAIAELRTQSRVCNSEWDRGALVHTFWDLGAPDNMVTWYVQFVGRDILIIDHDKGLSLTTTQRVAHMMAKGYGYGRHFLPHDANATQKGGLSFADELRDAGLKNIDVVPRTADVWLGINAVLTLLPRCWFRLPACEKGLSALEAYHRKQNTTDSMLSNDVVHDWSSHDADALRTLGEAEMHGLIKTTGGDRGAMNGGSGPAVKVVSGYRGTERQKPKNLVLR